MKNCVFCKIANGEIPSEFVLKSKNAFMIYDINPKTKIHLLIIPKKHLVFDDLSPLKNDIISELFNLAKKAAKKLKISTGYRLVINNGADSGQEIEHLHMHFLAGEKLKF